MIFNGIRIEFMLTILSVGLLAFMVLFNNINRHIRIKEMKIYLQKSNTEDNSIDHIGLVMKYRIHKRLYENQISQDNADMIELRVNSILSEKTISNKISLDQYHYLAIPSLFIINFFRTIIGKNPIKDIEEDKSYLYLEIAYYYERNKCYEKAIEIYDKALKEELNSKNNIAAILLHKGFCHSILGNYKKAKEMFNNVIMDYGNEDVAITATILLRYLEGFIFEILKIVKSERDSIVKGEKLYKLIAYKESFKVLEKIEKDADPSEKSRIKIFKARCLEELAEKEKAINIYQEIILEDRNSKYAKLANRRIFITGSLAYNGSNLKAIAVQNNKFLKDKIFSKLVDEAAKISQVEDVKGKLKNNKYFIKSMKLAVEERPVFDEEKVKHYNMSEIKSEDKLRGKRKFKKRPTVRKIKRTTIETIDGNIFIGSIEEESDDAVTVRTTIGWVKIEKKRIKRRKNLK